MAKVELSPPSLELRLPMQVDDDETGDVLSGAFDLDLVLMDGFVAAINAVAVAVAAGVAAGVAAASVEPRLLSLC